MSMKDAGCVYFYIMLLNASGVYCNLKSWQVSLRNSWQAKPFVRSKHFDLQNLLPKLEAAGPMASFWTFPLYLAGIIRCLPPKKNDWGQCSWVLKNHWKTSSENPGPILVIGYPMVFIVIGLQAFFILKTSLLKCQLHSTKNPQVASGFYGFLLAASEFSLWLSHSLASELDDPELPPERGEEAITSIHLGGIPPSGIMESQKKRLWQLD